MIDAKPTAAPAPRLWPGLVAMTALQALVSLALFAPGTVAPRAGRGLRPRHFQRLDRAPRIPPALGDDGDRAG